MKSTVRCRECDQRIWQKDRALHTMSHFIVNPFNKRQAWYEYQDAEKKCFGSIRGWKGEPSEEWLGGIYTGFRIAKK